MAAPTTTLWRKDPSSGNWKQVRICDVSSAHQWLLEAQKAEPEVTFKLSQKKPVG